MRLNQPLLKLPKAFDADRLAAEVRALPATAWLPHPGNYPGNDAVLLVTPEGQMTNGFTGQMAATDHLHACPYVMEVMGEIGAVWGRSRLMGLGPGAVVPPHVDVNYHWRTHTRIHVPIITNPQVRFTVGEQSVHMAPGECWVFDSFQMHNVRNGGTEKRVHLVLDTVEGEEIWDLIDAANNGTAPPPTRPPRPLRFETVDMHKIMSPWEVRCHIAFLIDYVLPNPRLEAVLNRLDRFAAAWSSAWSEYEGSPAGLPEYRRLIAALRQDLMASGGGNLPLQNQVPLARALGELILDVAAPDPAPGGTAVRLAS
ncbi:aspartyl/asparaginyl beta-hydroxylase domain-containing protein [Sphingomonas sp. BT-65]|uniref:aspartyl/asparaginyl beta-hydroxylase domain-containing protein n=1 Tax=Sphingomonas sp. BT-65 TaxID=2989821 RepID=UPI00223661E3|nr:aspartyl/asparaginyl beta-hydroxylase domain-containing protein [Sphingomonas sp. BT-65]MCW4461708.1 aspartyl/asparaginyl beta-hydroxylase domain-containing protein [Sphingomonas sp. BT-65]